MQMAIADLVSTLAKHEVEFIIVGGMAAILAAPEQVAPRERWSQAQETNQGPLDLLGTVEETTGFTSSSATAAGLTLVSSAHAC